MKLLSVDELMEKAFKGPRNMRSKEFKEGAKACLNCMINNFHIESPYTTGTPQDDAFVAGLQEGHRILQEEREY